MAGCSLAPAAGLSWRGGSPCCLFSEGGGGDFYQPSRRHRLGRAQQTEAAATQAGGRPSRQPSRVPKGMPAKGRGRQVRRQGGASAGQQADAAAAQRRGGTTTGRQGSTATAQRQGGAAAPQWRRGVPPFPPTSLPFPCLGARGPARSQDPTVELRRQLSFQVARPPGFMWRCRHHHHHRNPPSGRLCFA